MEDEVVKISILLEIYGSLLTEKQYNSINQYYNEDLSLSEIAEEQEISRQAVRDNISKAKERLFSFDELKRILLKELNKTWILWKNYNLVGDKRKYGVWRTFR